MVSNLLLECFVYVCFVVVDMFQCLFGMFVLESLLSWDVSQVIDFDEDVIIVYNWDELWCFMWDYVGIVCINKCLQCVQYWVCLLFSEIDEFYSNYKVSCDLIELCNLVLVVELIICLVMQCCESWGLYYMLDYLDLLFEVCDIILVLFIYGD